MEDKDIKRKKRFSKIQDYNKTIDEILSIKEKNLLFKLARRKDLKFAKKAKRNLKKIDFNKIR